MCDVILICIINTHDHVFNAHVHEPLRWVPRGQKNFFILTFLVLKARHFGGFAFCNWECLKYKLGGSAFCNFHRLGVSEQAMGGIPLGFGIVVEDKPFMYYISRAGTKVWSEWAKEERDC